MLAKKDFDHFVRYGLIPDVRSQVYYLIRNTNEPTDVANTKWKRKEARK